VDIGRHVVRAGARVRSPLGNSHRHLDLEARPPNRDTRAPPAALHRDATHRALRRSRPGGGAGVRRLHRQAADAYVVGDAPRRSEGVTPIAARTSLPLTLFSL